MSQPPDDSEFGRIVLDDDGNPIGVTTPEGVQSEGVAQILVDQTLSAAARLVRTVAQVDLRLAVWGTWQAEKIVNRPNERYGPRSEDRIDRALERWCLYDDDLLLNDVPGQYSNSIRYGLDLEFGERLHERGWLRGRPFSAQQAVERQLFPLQLHPANIAGWLKGTSHAMQVAWDATVDHHTPAALLGTIVPGAALPRLPVLTSWLQACEPDVGWTPTLIWNDRIGRMLCERSTLEQLPT